MHSCLVLIADLMMVYGTQLVVYGDLYLHMCNQGLFGTIEVHYPSNGGWLL